LDDDDSCADGGEASAESAVLVVPRGSFRQFGEMPPRFRHLEKQGFVAVGWLTEPS
jgi:hypothetical protein